MDPWADAAPWSTPPSLPTALVDPWAETKTEWPVAEAKEPDVDPLPTHQPPTPLADDEDPWGSGAAARQQEAESNAQRMEILRLQEEAKGKVIDDEGNEVEATPEKEAPAVEEQSTSETQGVTEEAPVATGWRALFNRGTAKPATSEEGKAKEEVSKIDTAVVASESPRASPATAAPRLWQAPAILGAHARSNSSSSRAGSIKEQPAKSVTPPVSNKGPGWEVTTKKQPNAGGGGGIIQSLFGSSTTTNEDDKATITTTRKEAKTTGLNRFGRGMQPPPVVSAADEEDDSFETESTGIEWEAGNIFDGKDKQLDLLSDDVEAKPAPLSVGKLLGRWRGKEASKAENDDLSKADFAWLETVGAGNSEVTQRSSNGASTTDSDTDWMAFINQQNSSASKPSIAAPMSERMRISSTSKGTVSTKIPALAPPPAPSSTSTHKSTAGAASGGQRVTSPFSFRGPDPASSMSSSRLASAVSARTTSTQDAFGDFEHASNPNGYRDDVTDNDAALLKDRPGQTRKDSGFLRALQGKARGSRYDYDEEDVDSHDDDWTAFRDEVPSKDSSLLAKSRNHAASPPLVPSASVERSKSGSSAVQSMTKPNSAMIPPPPSNQPQSWNRNGPLLPPPGRPHSTDQVKQNAAQIQPTTLAPSKPKTLSQGKTLTNDDLSFFESL